MSDQLPADMPTEQKLLAFINDVETSCEDAGTTVKVTYPRELLTLLYALTVRLQKDLGLPLEANRDTIAAYLMMSNDIRDIYLAKQMKLTNLKKRGNVKRSQKYRLHFSNEEIYAMMRSHAKKAYEVFEKARAEE